MMTGAGWGSGGGLWMIVEVSVGIAIVVALVWLIRTALPGRQRSATDDAVQILKTRLARGEITEVEYEQARRLIGSS